MHAFCRALLKGIMPDVRKHVPAKMRKEAWTRQVGYVGYGKKCHAFHGPDRFYWYGQSCCKWHARYLGWFSYLQKIGVEGYNEDTF